MGLFGIGGGGGKVARLVKKVTSKYGQASERQRAMHQLVSIGSDEALVGMMQRFTYRTEGGITDEEEKRLGYDLLLECGERAVAPIEQFVKESDGVYWPLKALKQIAGLEQAVELMLRALDSIADSDTRVNEQKTQLISNLRDFPHPLVFERLKGYVTDINPDVRMMAVDGVLTYGEELALPIIAERLLSGEETNSIKVVVFEQLVTLEWSMAEYAEALIEANLLPAHYRLAPDGKVIRAQ